MAQFHFDEIIEVHDVDVEGKKYDKGIAHFASTLYDKNFTFNICWVADFLFLSEYVLVTLICNLFEKFKFISKISNFLKYLYSKLLLIISF